MPSIVTRPDVSTWTPTSARINVLFPQPLGPSSPVTLPCSMVSPRRCSTLRPPRATTRSRTSTRLSTTGPSLLSHGSVGDEVLARERQRLAQVCLALRAGGGLASVDLQHQVTAEAGPGQVPQEPGRVRCPTSRHQVLVLRRARAVGEVDVPEPRSQPL